jgi:RNase P/RNase MRP subunit p29
LAQDDRRLVVRAKKLLRSVLIGVTLSVAATAAALTPGVDDRVIVWDTQTVSLDAATPLMPCQRCARIATA